MRQSVGIAVVIATVACGSEDADLPVVARSSPEVVAASSEPEHGGTVVSAGPYPVEVVAHRSGEVYAHVHGEAPPAGAEITVRVPVRGRSEPVPAVLVWNPRRDRYEGRVRRHEIVAGPVDVVIVVADVEYVGHVDVIVVAPAIEVHVLRHRGKHKWKGRGRGRGRVIVVH